MCRGPGGQTEGVTVDRKVGTATGLSEEALESNSGSGGRGSKTEAIFSCKLYQKRGCVRPERPIIDHGRGPSGKRGRNPRKAGKATVWLGAAPLPELLKKRECAVVRFPTFSGSKYRTLLPLVTAHPVSGPFSHPGAVETSGPWIPSMQAADPPPHLTDLSMMPGCVPRSPGAGGDPWGPGPQFGWPPYSEGRQTQGFFATLPPLRPRHPGLCWEVGGVPGMRGRALSPGRSLHSFLDQPAGFPRMLISPSSLAQTPSVLPGSFQMPSPPGSPP